MSGQSSVEASAFRLAIARWVTGVSVVTSRAANRDTGLTVNALLSVALTPPLLLISVNQSAESTPIIRESGAYAINVLSERQRTLSERFAQTVPAAEKFRGVPIHRGVTGSALLDGAIATIECRVRQEIPIADHALFVGEVVAVDSSDDEPPLIFYRSQYGSTNHRPVGAAP